MNFKIEISISYKKINLKNQKMDEFKESVDNLDKALKKFAAILTTQSEEIILREI